MGLHSYKSLLLDIHYWILYLLYFTELYPIGGYTVSPAVITDTDCSLKTIKMKDIT